MSFSFDDSLADRVKKLRKDKGLSQEELAEAAGVDPRTVQRIEKGKSKPQPANLRSIADALGVTVHDLQEPPQSRVAPDAPHTAAIVPASGEPGSVQAIQESAFAPM